MPTIRVSISNSDSQSPTEIKSNGEYGSRGHFRIWIWTVMRFRFFMNDDEDQVQLKIWATPVRFLSVKQWGDWVSSSVGTGFMLHIINVHTGEETLENNMECAEILGGDLSVFHLTTGAYYLCRHDFFELAEVCGLAPDWFRILVGDTIDYTDVRGWRKTGRPKQVNLSSIEEDIYNMAEMSKSAFTSSLFEGETKSLTKLQGETITVAKSQSKGIKNVFEPNYIPLWGSHSVCGHRSEMEDAIAVGMSKLDPGIYHFLPSNTGTEEYRTGYIRYRYPLLGIFGTGSVPDGTELIPRLQLFLILWKSLIKYLFGIM
ncbi:hypothetical protein HanHA89_Chr04g0165981 [Helianthus annuus]|nr:hypothetical protein HanHA89_Chr04g0165981 [Helianthus annuus]